MENDIDNDVLKDINLLKSLEQSISKNIEGNEAKLLDYQEPHAKKLIDIITRNGTALDASDPGIGKTYIAAYLCKKLDLIPIVICPKNVVSRWGVVLDDFGVNYVMVVNYELISRCKYVYKNTKIVSPNIKTITKGNKTKYEWNVDKNVIFIFDEVHRCKYFSTKNAKLLLAAKETGNKILMLSATVVEKPVEFAIFAYVLGFSDSLRVLIEWIKKLSSPSKTLHTMLYDKINPKAARLSIEELGDKFPETQITADTYTMKKDSEITKIYAEIAEKVKQYKEEGEQSKFIIAKLQNEFRKIELLKVPTFVELANDYIEDGFSVVIFVNYTDTLKLLAEKLGTTVLIHGDQTAKERDENIDKFQTDKSRIIIANIRAGGVGVSLHDINGKYPRVSLISPTHSATNLIQALGRIHRSGGKSKSLQRIIFAANTPEDNMSKMLFRKLANLSLLNDGDLETYFIDGLIKDEHIKIEHSDAVVNKDLKIVIDEQINRIKQKNIMKTDKMSDLFPKLIDTISGIQQLYLLKGKNVFNGKEILYLGERHTTNNPCTKCYNNCIEILDLVTYIMHCVHPNMVDFYIEKEYIPYTKTKMDMFALKNEDEVTRIEKLYSSFVHLINSKYPATEKLRMHSVDIRWPYKQSVYAGFDIKNVSEILRAFIMTFEVIFEIIGYKVSYIYHNLLKQSDGNKLKINYKKDTPFFDYYYGRLKEMHAFLNYQDIETILKRILNCDSELLDTFKITKQKQRAVETNDNNINDFVEKLEEQIKKVYFKSNINNNWSFFVDLKNILDSIKYIDDKKDFINAFINKFYEKKNHNIEQYNNTIDDIMDCLCAYMDMYTMYRMMRKFNNTSQDTIIFYGGYYHASAMTQALHNTGYFNLIAKRDDYLSDKQPSDCLIIGKTNY